MFRLFQATIVGNMYKAIIPIKIKTPNTAWVIEYSPE